MNINTILQILYANKLDHVVSLAIQIDNNIPLAYKAGDIIKTEISRNDLPKGKIFTKGAAWGTIEATIIGVNVYSIDKPYFIQLPDNKTSWIGEDKMKSNDYNLTPIIKEEEPTTT